MKYDVAANGEVCGRPCVAFAIISAGTPPGYSCSRLFRSGEPIANAACGAVIAPRYFAFQYVALQPQSAVAFRLEIEADRGRLAFLSDQILVAAREEDARHGRRVDQACRGRGRAARQADRAGIGVRDREVCVHAGGRSTEQAAERRLRGDAVAALPRLVSAGAVNDSA